MPAGLHASMLQGAPIAMITLHPGPGSLVQVFSVLAGPRTLDAAVSEFVQRFESSAVRELSRTNLAHQVPGELIRSEWSIDDSTFLIDTLLKVSGARLFAINFFRSSESEDARLTADFEQVLASFEIAVTPSLRAGRRQCRGQRNSGRH